MPKLIEFCFSVNTFEPIRTFHIHFVFDRKRINESPQILQLCEKKLPRHKDFISFMRL